MKRNWITSSLGLISMILTFAVTAAPGPLVSVAATGGETNYDINVWLNGLAPATGQKFHISSGTTLAITPLVPKGGSHCYNMGLEVTTPGYVVTTGATGPVNGIWQLPRTCTGQQANVMLNGGVALTCKGASGECRAFKTFTATKGDMSAEQTCNIDGTTGITRANCICNLDQNKPTQDAGIYAAWLSTPSISAIQNTHYSNKYNYINASSTFLIAAAGGTTFPVSLISNLADGASPLQVWTGTSSAGTYTAPNCTDWGDRASLVQGRSGSSLDTTSNWTDDGLNGSCFFELPLYCFELPS